MKKNTAIIKDDRYMNHMMENGHPESQKRLKAIYEMLDQDGISKNIITIKPRPAIKEEILLVHSPGYFDTIEKTRLKQEVALTPDTFASKGSYDAAMLAAGGIFTAIKGVVSNRYENAFVLSRPPGHHAEKSRAMGFCLFNNIALGAAFAKTFLKLKKILIVDWDVHHGNGTQHAFESDPSVLFFSIHQYPLFPGTGLFTETGIGRGEGFTVNIPLPRKYGDGEYAALFNEILKPLALKFSPDLILVSAGFDTHKNDPLGGMIMTSEGFGALTGSLMDIARACCNGKLILTLEGGYNEKALARSVKTVLEELSGKTHTNFYNIAKRADKKKQNYAVKRYINVHLNQ